MRKLKREFNRYEDFPMPIRVLTKVNEHTGRSGFTFIFTDAAYAMIMSGECPAFQWPEGIPQEGLLPSDVLFLPESEWIRGT